MFAIAVRESRSRCSPSLRAGDPCFWASWIAVRKPGNPSCRLFKRAFYRTKASYPASGPHRKTHELRLRVRDVRGIQTRPGGRILSRQAPSSGQFVLSTQRIRSICGGGRAPATYVRRFGRFPERRNRVFPGCRTDSGAPEAPILSFTTCCKRAGVLQSVIA